MKGHEAVTTEIGSKAAFTAIRYAQCWEDADILLEGLDVQEGDVCLGIGQPGKTASHCLPAIPAG